MARAAQPSEEQHYGAAFWVAVAVGWMVVAWGVWLFFQAVPDWGLRINFGVFFVGSALVHDLVIAPLVCAVAATAVVATRRRWRTSVRAGLIATGAVLLVAVLPLAGTADATGNPSIQPLDYTSATLTVLVALWAAVGAWELLARWRGRRRPMPGHDSEPPEHAPIGAGDVADRPT